VPGIIPDWIWFCLWLTRDCFREQFEM